MILVYFVQEKMMFFPWKLAADFQFNFKSTFEEKWTTFGQEKIHSLLFKNANPKGVILYFHGNAGSLENWGEVAERIAVNLNWDVWMYDYPGYGKSSDKIRSEEQLLQVAQAVFEDVRKNYPNSKIVLFGRSIGSGMAVHLASRNQVHKLILETPYTSLTDIAAKSYPYLPMFLLKYKMPSKDWIQRVKAPIMILHGTRDEVIPFAHAENLAKMVRDPVFVSFQGGYHNDLSDFKQYEEALAQFLDN
ncbi:alpha/beta hydrolase [Bdellovibrio sp. HCB2-146]|uniref:alpha/beta hydrolase n=1 Tax=Bdellovibrio sp. HCB2-146 TaxID=3394362 RepID=UPI0039BCA9EA